MENFKSLYSLILQHRRTYVQEENQEVGAFNLRLLRKSVHGLDEDKFIQAANFLSRFELRLQNLITSSLLNYYSIYDDNFIFDSHQRPLWLKLLRGNKSSRKLSPTLVASIRKLFSAFGIDIDIIVEETKDLNTLYALGAYSNVSQLLKNQEEVEYWQLKTAPLKFKPEIFLERVDQLQNTNKLHKQLLKAKYTVHSIQAGQDPISWSNFYDMNIIFENDISPEDAHLVVQLLNSLNFCALKARDKSLVEKCFRRLETVRKAISDEKSKSHLNGINHFHQAIANLPDMKMHTEYLQSALSYDEAFFDYYYRLADVFYEYDKDLTKELYELSIATSPLSLEVVNDYGAFLSEVAPEQAEKWGELMVGLGLFNEEDFNE